MLVLTRQENERIVIGDNITITVLEVRGGRVRLGVDAPPGVNVNRQEVWEAICRADSRNDRKLTDRTESD